MYYFLYPNISNSMFLVFSGNANVLATVDNKNPNELPMYIVLVLNPCV